MRKIFIGSISTIIIGIIYLLISYYIDSTRILKTEVYTVQPYDTIWSIAERFSSKDCRNPYILSYIEEIRTNNGFLRDQHYQLQVGDKLTISYYINN